MPGALHGAVLQGSCCAGARAAQAAARGGQGGCPPAGCSRACACLPSGGLLPPHRTHDRAASPLPPCPSEPPPAVMNWVGSLVAMLGTGLYSLAKQKASDDAKAAKAAAAAAQGGAA